MLLYIFAGFPGQDAPAGSLQLHGGGLQHCFENVEELALLEHDPQIQVRKEGVFLVTEGGDEWLNDFPVFLSARLLAKGITWEWFSKEWKFGNGVTAHKTLASLEYRTVIHGTDMTLEEFKTLNRRKPYRPSDLTLLDEPWKHEGWRAYEARWLPGTCPQENHIVHLTWLVTTHKIPDFAYQRIKELIEDGAEPNNLHLYSSEPGKHFAAIRRCDGSPSFERGTKSALSMH